MATATVVLTRHNPRDKSDVLNKYKTIEALLTETVAEHVRRIATGRAAMESGKFKSAINLFRRALADAMTAEQDYEARCLIEELVARNPQCGKFVR